MHDNLRAIPCALVMIILLVGGCASESSQLVLTYRDPSFAGPIAFKKTMVMAIYPDGPIRRDAEDELVKLIGPERAVAASQVLTEEDRQDVDKIEAKNQSNHIDGVVTLRITDAQTQTIVVPNASKMNYSYNNRVFVSDPGTALSSTRVHVQINIYSVAEQKLIWTGVSETFDPTDTRKVIDGIAKAVGEDLRKEHLLQ